MSMLNVAKGTDSLAQLFSSLGLASQNVSTYQERHKGRRYPVSLSCPAANLGFVEIRGVNNVRGKKACGYVSVKS